MKKTIDSLKACPKCGGRWQFEKNIYDTLKERYPEKPLSEIEDWASQYGHTEKNPQYFSYLIGIEDRNKYDGVSYWKCPHCNALWDRFTNQPVELTV